MPITKARDDGRLGSVTVEIDFRHILKIELTGPVNRLEVDGKETE